MSVWYHFDTIQKTRTGTARKRLGVADPRWPVRLAAQQQLAQVIERRDHSEFTHGLAVSGQHHRG